MKSRTVLNLAVESDLTETALYNAQQLIIEHNIENENFDSFKYQVLRVASQNMGIAPFLASHIGATIEVSPTYTADEWSLNEISHHDGESRAVTVHSVGV